MITVTLSYTICCCTPWQRSFDKVGAFILKEMRTSEEKKALREQYIKNGISKKVSKWRYTNGSIFEIVDNKCYFLIGAWHILKEALDKSGLPYTVVDKRDPSLRPPVDYSRLAGIELRPGQDIALASIIASDGGLICSNVSFGKSFIIKLLCLLYPKLNILIVCNSGEVVRELFRAVAEVAPGA